MFEGCPSLDYAQGRQIRSRSMEGGLGCVYLAEAQTVIKWLMSYPRWFLTDAELIVWKH